MASSGLATYQQAVARLRARVGAARARRLARYALWALLALWTFYAAAKALDARHVTLRDAPLDDAFIHAQYARTLAEGRPFRYGSPTDAPTSGATSVLFAVLLAVPYALGLKGAALLYASRALGVAAHALSAEGMFQLGRAAAGRTGAWTAGLLTFACAGLAWSATSAMETPLAVASFVWSFVLCARYAARREPPLALARALAIVTALGPWVRPELSVLCLLAALLLLARRAPRTVRAWGALPLLSTLALPLFWRLVTGAARTTGAAAKWIFLGPYGTHLEKLERVLTNAKNIYTATLAGDGWAAKYLPAGFQMAVLVGLLWALRKAWLRRSPWLAFVWLCGAAAAATQATFALWEVHRYRYLWPQFTPLLVLGAAATARLGHALAARSRARVGGRAGNGVARALRWLPAAGLLAVFAQRLPAALDDMADASRQINEQHVRLTRDHVQRLPRGSRVLINDAGVIAYLGGHATIDFVGLTTAGFAEAFRSGPASVFEALERLPADRRPTHLAAYLGWLRTPELVGRLVGEASVRDNSILGEGTKVCAEFNASVLGLAEVPLHPLASGERVVDRFDVADVASEHEHGYENPRTNEEGNRLFPLGAPVPAALDGARIVTERERFTLRATPGRPATLFARWAGRADPPLRLYWNGVELRSLGRVTAGYDVAEHRFELAPSQVQATNDLRTTVAQPVPASLHYLLAQAR